MVDFTLYRCSLVAALSLMVFFSLTFVFGRLPDPSAAYRRYGEARLRLGLALLVLSANYAVHLFVAPRFAHPEWAIMMNLDTYYIAAWLFGSSMHHLLSHDYNSPRRDLRNVGSWMAFALISGTLLIIAPSALWDTVVLVLASVVFMLYTLRVALRLLAAYRRAVRLLDDYHSDNAATYIKWMSVFTYLAVGYGIGQGVFTFIPDRYVYLWILSSIPFYAYGYISYINYSLDMGKVDEALECDNSKAETHLDETRRQSSQPLTNGIDTIVGERLERWIESGSFTCQGLNIVQLAQTIGTNRTYVSAYINNHYHVSFREWINSLRLDYAKRLLVSEPSLTIADIAQRAGYQSLSNFTRLFAASEGVTPGRWRKENN